MQHPLARKGNDVYSRFLPKIETKMFLIAPARSATRKPAKSDFFSPIAKNNNVLPEKDCNNAAINHLEIMKFRPVISDTGSSLPDTFAGALVKWVKCHGDRHIRVHEMFEQPQAELEQTENATVGAMNDSAPSFTY